MASDFSVRGATVTVVGGGRSGQAAAALLAARGAHVTLADTAARLDGTSGLEAAGIRVELGPHRLDTLTSADLVVLSPGVSPASAPVQAARTAGVPIIGELELASRWLSGKVVAITGTKGKSTTTTLTALMLREAGFSATAGGNLGVPLSAQVAESTPEAIHVVEVSSFQLETADTFHPWIAVLLNLSPDHLDRHASFEEYAAAKGRIFQNQTRDDWAVVNAEEPSATALAAGGAARRFDFAVDTTMVEGVCIEDSMVVSRRDGRETPLFPVAAVRLPGRHMLANVLAASATSALAGASATAMRRAVEGFAGLEHTLERAGAIGEVRFVNDSKATNVAAAARSIESVGHGVVPIMGGRYKGGSFEDLRPLVRDYATAVVAIGEAAGRIESALVPSVPVHRAASMDEAVERAFALAQPDGVVLLAPACSSFDMFVDYAARGRAFKDAVARLMRVAGSGSTTTGGRPM